MHRKRNPDGWSTEKLLTLTGNQKVAKLNDNELPLQIHQIDKSQSDKAQCWPG